MKNVFTGVLFATFFAGASAVELKRPPRPEPYNRHQYLDERIEMKPLLDTPLQHTFIMRGPDQIYYLTGTVSADGKGEDFQNNDGVWLWKSADFKTWEPAGQVWSLEKEARVSPQSAWQLDKNLNPENPSGPLVRGLTAPEIHFLKGSWWIPYSMNGQGTGLLKSQTGKPEGPYEDVGRMTGTEGDASLFEDFDGAVYWVWGPGRIARMKEDMTGLAEPPHQITLGFPLPAKASSEQPHCVLNASIHKITPPGKKPRYHLLFESGNCRIGAYTRDTFIASSDKLFGPYGAGQYDIYGDAQVLIEHGGQATLFQDAAGQWYGTFYGADNLSVWRNRPGIVTTTFDNQRGRPSRHHYFKDFPTRGPWATVEPLFRDAQVNDEQILSAPDGYYYFTGSVWDDFRWGGLTIWKSKTLEPRKLHPENWKEIPGPTYADIPFIRSMAQADPSLLDFTIPRKSQRLGAVMWNPEIHFVKGTFWMMGQTGFADKAVQDAMAREGIKGCPLWKSTTGKAEGPYEVHAWITYSCPSFFEDDDGAVYHLEGVNRIKKMKADMSGYDEEWDQRMSKKYPGFQRSTLMQRENLNMDYDIGNCMVKIGGKYVFFSCNCVGGSYDYQYWVARDILGPYSRPRVMMPFGGHSFVMKDKQGVWRCLQWSHTTAMAPCLHELHVEDTGDDVIIMPRWEFERQQQKGRP